MDIVESKRDNEHYPDLPLQQKLSRLNDNASLFGGLAFGEKNWCFGGNDEVVFIIGAKLDELKITIGVKDPSDITAFLKKEDKWVPVHNADQTKLAAKALRLVEEADHYMKSAVLAVKEELRIQAKDNKQKVDELLDA